MTLPQTTNPDKHCAKCSSGLFESVAMDLHRQILARCPLPPNSMKMPHNENTHYIETSAERCPTTIAANLLREVTVTGTAAGCSPADRASVRVSVGSSPKDTANEATNSVSRRIGYILQTLR